MTVRDEALSCAYMVAASASLLAAAAEAPTTDDTMRTKVSLSDLDSNLCC